jgi:transposase
VLFRELQTLGYSGGLTTLKLYLAGLKPTPQSEPLLLFETEPGRQPQADFATLQRGAERLSVFIATLDWSRTAYVELAEDERLEMLLDCHGLAFEYFGGVRARYSMTTWTR